MQMLTMRGDTLVAQRPGRTIEVQRITDTDRYQALRAFGVQPAVAAALMAGLITVTVKTV